MTNRKNITIVVCAVLVVFLQLWLAPMINVFGASPSFGLAAIVAFSLILDDKPHILLCVLVGLAFDLTQGEPFGVYTLMFVVTGYVVQALLSGIGNDSAVTNIVTGAIATFVAGLIQLVIIGFATPGIGFFDLVATGALLGLVLDCIAFAIFYLIFDSVIPKSYKNVWGTSF